MGQWKSDTLLSISHLPRATSCYSDGRSYDSALLFLELLSASVSTVADFGLSILSQRCRE